MGLFVLLTVRHTVMLALSLLNLSVAMHHSAFLYSRMPCPEEIVEFKMSEMFGVKVFAEFRQACLSMHVAHYDAYFFARPALSIECKVTEWNQCSNVCRVCCSLFFKPRGGSHLPNVD